LEVYLIGEIRETAFCDGKYDTTSNRKKYFGVLSGKRGNRNSNIVVVYLKGLAAETVTLWGYIR